MAVISLDKSPFHKFLNLKLLSQDDGAVEIVAQFRNDFLRADGSDWLHGGVISALIDIAGDYAVATQAGGAAVPTIDLRVDFLRPARKGDLTATGKTVRVGKTVGIANVEVRDAYGTLSAIGRGVYACPKP